MKRELFNYLDFLLPTHNCVIIQNLGAFIINLDISTISKNGEVQAPRYTITFNPEITHNDGVLPSYIMKIENITYDAACNKIKESVKRIKSDLKINRYISCGNIGSMSMNIDENIIFTPNRDYTHPDYIGLYHTGIRRIEDINESIDKEKKYISFKYIAGSVAAAAVAILLFTIPSVNINNNQEVTQSASFLSSISTSLSLTNKEVTTITFPKVETPTQRLENNQVWEKPARTYYIIIGGEESKSRADILLSKIQNEDFKDASIIESPDRYRIYVASFFDKKEAELFLEGFRKDNPKYGTAWLLSKRNP
ncbi:hypothetical protein GGR21_003283 [Dysgonomonas hofstadii]|uniref:SPOR domain-containing protein n=1 Tax=Dysgonomonas hofstadii TaxID=637886 RepID=A0A840CPN5_9BACT|nr:SPOR domain-containing protein [Dysgonomonas hofstadii]MBB4037366.1 hypothetical protein [Dysgonomonas hofstadii]